VAIYRTEVNGTVFYRLTHNPGNNVLLDPGHPYWQTYTDTVADANIGTSGSATLVLNKQPQPYTAGGTIDDDPPPSFLTAAVHQRRVAGLSGDGRTVWFSKDMSEEPGVVPGFNFELTVSFDRDKTALASLDQALVVLGSDSVDLVTGDGSPSTGTPFGWNTTRVQVDIGCTQPRSVVSGPMGVFFASARGMELLDRGLTVTWRGRRAQDELTTYPVVTSAVLVAADHEIRWTCIKADGSSGIVLVYDYANDAWYTRKYYDADTSNASVAFVDAALIGGVYTMLTAGGRVYQETSSSFLDGGSQWVTLHVETANISPNGPLAWHSIKQMSLLGSSLTHHDLEVRIAKDFSTTWDQTRLFGADTDITGAPSTLETVRMSHKTMKVQSVRYYIADAPPSNGLSVGTGEGAMLEGLGLITRPKSGFPKRSATREA
jgi:hypothetical protein